jgi:hypothetical protein
MIVSFPIGGTSCLTIEIGALTTAATQAAGFMMADEADKLSSLLQGMGVLHADAEGAARQLAVGYSLGQAFLRLFSPGKPPTSDVRVPLDLEADRVEAMVQKIWKDWEGVAGRLCWDLRVVWPAPFEVCLERAKQGDLRAIKQVKWYYDRGNDDYSREELIGLIRFDEQEALEEAKYDPELVEVFAWIVGVTHDAWGMLGKVDPQYYIDQAETDPDCLEALCALAHCNERAYAAVYELAPHFARARNFVAEECLHDEADITFFEGREVSQLAAWAGDTMFVGRVLLIHDDEDHPEFWEAICEAARVEPSVVEDIMHALKRIEEKMHDNLLDRGLAKRQERLREFLRQLDVGPLLRKAEAGVPSGKIIESLNPDEISYTEETAWTLPQFLAELARLENASALAELRRRSQEDPTSRELLLKILN